jgi:predicted RNase H-like HicB family nuclease
MVIQWSEKDHAFVVSLPEFGCFARTHGRTYEEAAKKGHQALESLIDAFKAEGKALPLPVQPSSPVPA